MGRVENIDDLASKFGCKVGSLPSTYLGLPLGAPFKSMVAWDGVEERFHKKVGHVEETIHFQRRKNNLNSKHCV